MRSNKFNAYIICKSLLLFRTNKSATTKINETAFATDFCRKSVVFCLLRPRLHLKMQAAEGIPKGTPFGGFFGSFLVRARNERILYQTDKSKFDFAILPESFAEA